jgi:DNA-binding MarR family transcriptional regulator
MVLTEMAEFGDWLRRGEAPTVDRYVEWATEDPARPSIGTIVEHGGIDQLFEELAGPDALERAYRELNPTAEELAVRESEQLERRLLHPTPQGILRVITERGEASAGELGEALGIEKGSVNNWLPHLEQAGKIERTTPSRVAKNVKYCLKGQAPTPDEVKQRKLEKAVAGERCQSVLKLIRENDGITMAEMSEVLGSRPEVVAKWVRPLKALGYVQQVDDRTGGNKRTWYRELPDASHLDEPL